MSKKDVKDNTDLFEDEQEIEREEQTINAESYEEPVQGDGSVGIVGLIAPTGEMHVELIGKPTPEQLRTITGKLYHDTNDMLLAGRIMDAFMQVQMMASKPYKAGN